MEIRKIMNETNIEEIFDVKEESCAADCHVSWYWAWNGTTYVLKEVKNSHYTTLF